MRWTPRGAHLLLQVRTRVLNDDLADQFRRWHPGFTHTIEARQPGSPLPRNLPRFAPLSSLAAIPPPAATLTGFPAHDRCSTPYPPEQPASPPLSWPRTCAAANPVTCSTCSSR